MVEAPLTIETLFPPLADVIVALAVLLIVLFAVADIGDEAVIVLFADDDVPLTFIDNVSFFITGLTFCVGCDAFTAIPVEASLAALVLPFGGTAVPFGWSVGVEALVAITANAAPFTT